MDTQTNHEGEMVNPVESLAGRIVWIHESSELSKGDDYTLQLDFKLRTTAGLYDIRADLGTVRQLVNVPQSLIDDIVQETLCPTKSAVKIGEVVLGDFIEVKGYDDGEYILPYALEEMDDQSSKQLTEEWDMANPYVPDEIELRKQLEEVDYHVEEAVTDHLSLCADVGRKEIEEAEKVVYGHSESYGDGYIDIASAEGLDNGLRLLNREPFNCYPAHTQEDWIGAVRRAYAAKQPIPHPIVFVATGAN